MFKGIREMFSCMVKNNVIVEHLCCGPRWRRMLLCIRMIPVIKELALLDCNFTATGELRFRDAPFNYDKLSADPEDRERIYSKLKDAITNYVYQSLVIYHDLVAIPVPRWLELGRGTFIFVTPDVNENDVLLILISGTEDARAGQWSQTAIMQDGLKKGSQIPYVKTAVKKGWGVMIMNPADNYRNRKIPLSGSPEEHAKHVWNAYVRRTKATKILIVAHAYGGIVTACLANERKRQFEDRVAGVALIDSHHVYSEYNVTRFFKKVSKHWASSDAPLDTPLPNHYFDVPKFSSGHLRAGVTPYSCKHSVFGFFEEKLSTAQVITQQVQPA